MNVAGGAYFGPQENVNCDPYYASVSLLLHCDGSGAVSVGNLLDSGPNTNTPSSISSGTVTYYPSPVKWGVSSIASSGGPYVLYNDSSLWDFGAGDFTVECWAYAQSASGGFFTGFTRFFVGRAAPSLSATTASWGLGFTGGPGAWIQGAPYVSMIGASGTAYEVFGSAPLSSDTWHHLAMSRVGSTVYLLADGAVSGTTTVAEAIKNPVGANLGILTYGDNGFPYVFDAWIDDVRVTKGVGRYSGSYTVPTAAFPNTVC